MQFTVQESVKLFDRQNQAEPQAGALGTGFEVENGVKYFMGAYRLLILRPFSSRGHMPHE